ncbi:MAG: S-layer homology domain-containing protein, partial [Candidatus Margulisiibacteriota bacterium]
ALLVRTMAGGDDKVPIASKEAFKDVNLKHWAIKYVNLAVSREVVKGYPDKTFRPSANITRAEGLAMIARFGGVKETPYTGAEFKDVNAKNWAATIIAGSFKEGLLNYFKGKAFEPNKKLTRAEAVEMLYRSRPVVILVNDLNDFEKGY